MCRVEYPRPYRYARCGPACDEYRPPTEVWTACPQYYDRKGWVYNQNMNDYVWQSLGEPSRYCTTDDGPPGGLEVLAGASTTVNGKCPQHSEAEAKNNPDGREARRRRHMAK